MPKKRTIRVQGLKGRIRTKYPLFANKEIKSEIDAARKSAKNHKDLSKVLVIKHVEYKG